MAAGLSRICRDCGAANDAVGAGPRCGTCASPRLVDHPELHNLSIAHIDCDAFYAAIEKRDDPSIADRAVLIGGGRRGVVAACCYVARIHGVRSAMPMFKALALCPDAVVIRPAMEKYRAAGRQIRAMMLAVTPLVEPLSIDEAFLDLAGTERLHGRSAAGTLVRLAQRVEREVGITVSVGLAPNKMLAKLASDRDKPRGFAVIGRAEAAGYLAPLPIGVLPGIGERLADRLRRAGIATVGALRQRAPGDLARWLGAAGPRLHAFAGGEDDRPVVPERRAKNVSAETTLDRDVADVATLAETLWPLCETVSRRLKQADLAAHCIVLKLKTGDFRNLTRSRTLHAPTQLAEVLYQQAAELLRRAAPLPPCRLIGIGTSELVAGIHADPPDLADPAAEKRRRVEQAIDAVRARVGAGAIQKGRGFSTSAAPGARTPPAGREPQNPRNPGPAGGRRRSPGVGS